MPKFKVPFKTGDKNIDRNFEYLSRNISDVDSSVTTVSTEITRVENSIPEPVVETHTVEVQPIVTEVTLVPPIETYFSDNDPEGYPDAVTSLQCSMTQDVAILSWDFTSLEALRTYEVYSGTTSGFSPDVTTFANRELTVDGTVVSVPRPSGYFTAPYDIYYKVCAVNTRGERSTFEVTGPHRFVEVTSQADIEELIDAIKVETGWVTDAQLADGAVTIAKLASDSVHAPKLKANAVTSTAIAPYAVAAANLAPGSVALGSSAVVGDLSANRISAGTLASGVIYSGEIGTDQLYVSEEALITSAMIGTLEAGKITAGTLAAGVIYSDKIGTNQIIAQGALLGDAQIGNLNASHITSGTIASNVIHAGKVYAEKIDVTNAQISNAQIASIEANKITTVNALIKNAQIESIAANKITAGSISANVAHLGTVLAEQITGTTISGINVFGGRVATAASGSRAELSSFNLGAGSLAALTFLDSEGFVGHLRHQYTNPLREIVLTLDRDTYTSSIVLSTNTSTAETAVTVTAEEFRLNGNFVIDAGSSMYIPGSNGVYKDVSMWFDTGTGRLMIYKESTAQTFTFRPV